MYALGLEWCALGMKKLAMVVSHVMMGMNMSWPIWQFLFSIKEKSKFFTSAQPTELQQEFLFLGARLNKFEATEIA